MSIRTTKQDHFKERATALEIVPKEVQDEVEAELVFTTENEKKPGRVDLREFFYGSKNPNTRRWSGDFKSRPNLIIQLAPAIRESWKFLSKSGVTSRVQHIRKWFRLLDTIEATVAAGSLLKPVYSVEDLAEIHGQLANDKKLSINEFGTLKSVVDTTRAAMGLPQLFWAWQGDRSKPSREFPSDADFAEIFHQLKRRWFGALDRWERADVMCSWHKAAKPSNADMPKDVDEEQQLLNYIDYRNHVEYVGGKALLSGTERIRSGRTPTEFRTKGLHTGMMLRGHFPDVHDVRAAFHLCLQGTGWNPQTLLDLPVTLTETGDVMMPFLKNHPTNELRYVMRGFKSRGASDPASIGDWKTSRSPGAVIRALVTQTAPIRRTLRSEAEAIEHTLATKSLSFAERGRLRKRAEAIARMIASPWLYVEPRGIIAALSETTYYQANFLQNLVDDINKGRQPKNQIPPVVATDLRDAFATFAFGLSGGSVMAVRFAINHRSLRSINPYLVNRLLAELAQKEFLKFETFLWMEILQRGKADPTVLAKLVRDGKMTHRERFRLKRYRNLRLSRLHMHCRKPTEPPKRVDPNFVPDGESLCVAQRCLLCYEHAALSAESIDGVCMRKAELIHLKGNMSIHAFTSDSFQEEDENADAVLSMFPPARVTELLETWRQRIASGEHRVIEFIGVQGRLKKGQISG